MKENRGIGYKRISHIMTEEDIEVLEQKVFSNQILFFQFIKKEKHVRKG